MNLAVVNYAQTECRKFAKVKIHFASCKMAIKVTTVSGITLLFTSLLPLILRLPLRHVQLSLRPKLSLNLSLFVRSGSIKQNFKQQSF